MRVKWNSYRLKNIIKSGYCRKWNSKRNATLDHTQTPMVLGKTYQTQRLNATLNELRIVKVLSQSHDNVCRAINQLLLCGVGVLGYIKDLSKTKSVTPQRHRGFFVPVFSVSQPESIGSKSYLYYLQVQSVHTVYGWKTSKNKPFGEYSGRLLFVPRVIPPTLLNLCSVVLSQKQKGGLSHA